MVLGAYRALLGAVALASLLACGSPEGGAPPVLPCATDADCGGTSACSMNWCTRIDVAVVQPAADLVTNGAQPVRVAVQAESFPVAVDGFVHVLVDGRSVAVGIWPLATYDVPAGGLPEGEHLLGGRVVSGTRVFDASPVRLLVDRSPPVLVAQRPAAGLPELPGQTFVELEFSEPIRPPPLNCARITTDVHPWGAEAVCSLSQDGRSIRVETPSLRELLSLAVTLEAPVVDLQWNATTLPIQASWSQPPLQVAITTLPGTPWPYVAGTVPMTVEVSGSADAVLLYRGASDVENLAGPPYRWDWDTTAYAEGSWYFHAVARRGARPFESEWVTAFIDRTPPRVTWLGPIDGVPTDQISVRTPIVAVFSEPVDLARLDASWVRVTDELGAPMPYAVETDPWNWTRFSIHRRPIPAVPSTVRVELTAAVVDLAGLPIPPASATWLQPAWLPLGAVAAQPGGRIEASRVECGPATRATWQEAVPGSPSRVVDGYFPGGGTVLNFDPAGEADSPNGDGAAFAWRERGADGAWALRAMQRLWEAPWLTWFTGPLAAGLDPLDPSVARRDAIDDRPVLAWSEATAQGRAVRVVRWDGAAWASLGDPAGAALAGSPSVAVDPGDRPMVAWIEAASASDPPSLLVRRWDGQGWAAPEGPLNADPAQPASPPVLVLDGAGAPVLAWSEGQPGTRAVWVARWDGLTWSRLDPIAGGAGAEAVEPSLRVDGAGNPVVAFLEVSASGRAVHVVRWQGGAWAAVASPVDGGPDVGAPVIAIGDWDLPCVGWTDGTGGLRVARHNQ